MIRTTAFAALVVATRILCQGPLGVPEPGEPVPAWLRAETGAAAFAQACRDATTDGLVLNIAAHPDDEAARTLTLLRRRYGLRTVTLYSTSGSGGQNAIGREIGAELAALRVRETLAAARHTGVVVRWLGFPDFGFSKTRDETVRVWNEEGLLSRMREEVAAARPDLVFTNHSLTRGHGHHRASRWAVARALESLPRSVPLYERTDLEHQQFEIDPTVVDPVRGETYARQAHRGYMEHATQGPWSPHNPLRVRKDRWRIGRDEPAELAEGDSPLPAVDPLAAIGSMFDEPSVVRVLRDMEVEPSNLERRMDRFGAERPRSDHRAEAKALLPLLRKVYVGLPAEEDWARARVARRLDALQRILVHGAGIEVEAWLPRDEWAWESTGEALVVVHGRGQGGLHDLVVDVEGAPAVPTVQGQTMAEARSFRGAFAVGAPARMVWQTPWVHVDLRGTVDGVPVQLRRALPYAIEAPLTVRWSRRRALLPARGTGERVFSLSVVWRGTDTFEAPLRLGMGAGLSAEAVPARLSLSPERPEARVLVRVTFDGAELGDDARLRATLGEFEDLLEFDVQDLELDPDLRVGLVRGPDDSLVHVLSDLGVPFVELDRDALAVADLEEFSTLVLDIRAYHHRPELAEHRERMLAFCRAGGRVLAFYHKPREWNASAGRPLLAPFSMEVGNLRVTEQDAPVQFLEPDHPLLSFPHRLSADDFEGWVQERGLNFPTRWDPAWTPLLAMRDSGEKDLLTGSLLHTHYGKGDYVYCSLALYRQLRLPHPGAVRLLVNLLTP